MYFFVGDARKPFVLKYKSFPNFCCRFHQEYFIIFIKFKQIFLIFDNLFHEQ